MLPTPIVIIEQAPEVPAEIRQAVFDGCTQGLGKERCIGKDEPRNESLAQGLVRYEAQLVWSKSYSDVRILVAVDSGVLERRVHFQSADGAVERGAAAGLVAATAVATHLALQGETPPREPEPPGSDSSVAPPPPPEEKTTAKPSPPRLRTDIGLSLGSGLREGPLAQGGFLRLSLSGWMPPILPLFALSYSHSGGAITGTRWRTWLGLGTELNIPHAPLAIELSGSLAAELFEISATLDGQRDRESRLRLGGLTEADLIWDMSDSVQPFVGARASILWPDVDVAKEGELVDYRGVFGWTALGGIRFKL